MQDRNPDEITALELAPERTATNECAICACDVFDREELCDDCANVACPQCHGTQIGYYAARGKSVPSKCSECDGHGYVSRARGRKA